MEFHISHWQTQIFLPQSLDVVIHLKSIQVILMGFHKRQIGVLTFAAKFYNLPCQKLLTNRKKKIQLLYFPTFIFFDKESYTCG